MRTVTWIDLVAAENVPCRALFLVVVTPRTLGAKHVNAKTRDSMVQHDASFQHRTYERLFSTNPIRWAPELSRTSRNPLTLLRRAQPSDQFRIETHQ